MTEVRVVGDVVAALGECPLWSIQEQVLYWADIDGRKLHRYDPSADTTTSHLLSGRPGSFVATPSMGRLLVGMETEAIWLDWQGGYCEPFVPIEDPGLGNRLNDGRCDPAGNYIVGTMSPDTAAKAFTGALYRVEPGGDVTTLETKVGIPNGLVFDAELSRMYWADTFHATIWVWDYDPDTGVRSNRRVFFNYDDHDHAHGLPDGACLDAEGFYWSASVHGWAVTRISPKGVVDRIIDVPVAMPTMPAFGGPDLSTLYVTSIDGGLVDPKRSRGVPAGSLLAIDLSDDGLRGVPEPSFGHAGPTR